MKTLELISGEKEAPRLETSDPHRACEMEACEEGAECSKRVDRFKKKVRI
mgnify:CR=1 FL=1